MNYYEELGVRQDASERDIRQAYRLLVRVLHPDVQTSDDLRQAAERQLNRLNEVLAVLTNEETRRAYDLELEQGTNPRGAATPIRPPASRAVRVSPLPGEGSLSQLSGERSLTQFALKHWTIILIGLVILSAATLSALLHGSESAVEVQTPGSQPPARRLVAARPAARTPGTQPLLPGPRPAAHPVSTLDTSAGQIEAPKEEEGLPVKPLLPALETPAAVSGSTDSRHIPEPMAEPRTNTAHGPAPARPSPSPALTPAPSFSGNWLYTTDLSPTQQNDGYRAIYVELMLTEREGTLHGDYRARYVVPDKAISPQVSFHLQGRTSSERKARVSWSSANGARGEAELNLSAPGIMDIRWWTIYSAEQSGLSSGSAKLVRHRTQ